MTKRFGKAKKPEQNVFVLTIIVVVVGHLKVKYND